MVFEEDRKPLKAADWVIIAFYFLACILVGLWVCAINSSLSLLVLLFLLEVQSATIPPEQRLLVFLEVLEGILHLRLRDRQACIA